MFYKCFEDGRAAGNSFVNIEVINDGTLSNETRLGAIGDIGLVLGKKDIRNDLLIMGSDNLFDMDLADFIKFSSERRPGSALLLFDVGDKEKAKRYGIFPTPSAMKIPWRWRSLLSRLLLKTRKSFLPLSANRAWRTAASSAKRFTTSSRMRRII